jgi:hypothetical protein
MEDEQTPFLTPERGFVIQEIMKTWNFFIRRWRRLRRRQKDINATNKNRFTTHMF